MHKFISSLLILTIFMFIFVGCQISENNELTALKVTANEASSKSLSELWIDVWNGNWGGWRSSVIAPINYYVIGAQVRFEDPQGLGDDTAMNGLRLLLKNKYSGVKKLITVFPGKWGAWKDWAIAPEGYYAYAASIRYESKQGLGDDTAMNGLKLKFRNPKTGQVVQKMVWSGAWGTWRPWATAPYGYYFTGGKVRFESHQGVGDDTAMNGLKFSVRRF